MGEVHKMNMKDEPMRSITQIAPGSETIAYLIDPYVKGMEHLRQFYFVVGETFCRPDYYCRFFAPTHACMMYFVSGSGTLRVENETHVIRGGTVILMREGCEWEYATDPNDPWKLFWINFSSKSILSFFDIYKTAPLSILENEAVLPDYWKLYEDVQNKDLTFAERRDRALRHALVLIQSYYAALTQRSKRKSQTQDAELITEYINAHIMEDLSVGDLAAMVFRSPASAIKIFRQTYGYTVKEYILNAKCELAANMLREGDRFVSEISDMLSFGSSQHFSQVFKSRFGVTPSEYRQQYEARKKDL